MSQIAHDPDSRPAPDSGAVAVSAPLGRAAMRGVGWTLFGRGLDRTADIIRYLVLARLLEPAQMGAFGLVSVASLGLQALTFTGFRLALIRRREDPTPLYDTAFCVELLRGVILASLAYLAAPYVAVFFQAPVTSLLQVQSLTMVLLGAVNIGTIEFERNLNFRKRVLMTRSAVVVSLVVGLTLAAIFRSVWALVIAELCHASTVVILSYWLHPYRPRLRFRWKDAYELFSFGIWITINAIGFFFLQQFDSLVVAKRLGQALMAQYQIAYRLSMFPINSMREVITSVTFPIFSKITDEPARLARAYSQIFAALSAVVAPAALLLVCYGEEVIFLALGTKWMAAAPLVRILALFSLVQMVVFSIEPIFQALGKPQLTTISRYCHLAVIVPTVLWLVSKFGAVGAAWGVTLAGLAPLCILMSLLVRLVPGVASPLMRNLLGLLPALGLLVGSAMLVRSYSPQVPLDASLFSWGWWMCLGWCALGGGIAGAIYLAALFVIESRWNIGIAQVVTQVRGALRRGR